MLKNILTTATLIAAAGLSVATQAEPPPLRSATPNRLAINPAAGSVATTELEIHAPPHAVWKALTDIDNWTRWMPEFSAARLDGPLAPGTIIFWEPYGAKIESRIVAVDAGKKLVWNGTDGAVHVWELIPTRDGTLLRNAESIDSWHAVAPDGDGSAMLKHMLGMWNERLALQAMRLQQHVTLSQ